MTDGRVDLPNADSLDRLSLNSKKRYYILFVSRDEDGTLNKVPVPLRYAYVFVAAAVIGMFTITGMAGSYSRMLIKTARFNKLRTDHDTLQKDYAHLEKQAHEKDIQAASLGSLATEVSALYGLTTSKLASVKMGRPKTVKAGDAAKSAGTAPLADVADVSTTNDDSYTKSLDAFYALRSNALDGDTTKFLTAPVAIQAFGRVGLMANLGRLDSGALGEDGADSPSIWPITGPITSSFGEREDPILGNGEGEFHPGIDISAPQGTAIHATADGVVESADVVNGYGRMVAINHGHGVVTLYGHMSGFAVTAGQQVSRGQVIGYVGHTGRTTGNHVHYEVRIRNSPVNPHKYLRTTLAQLASMSGELNTP